MRFEKVSFEQYACTRKSDQAAAEYAALERPRRATAGSAGYDFFAPFGFTLAPEETILIPTGIRVLLDSDKALFLFPRSGLGFKYRMQMDNTVGIIDADYAGSKNEGHIMARITNDSRTGKTLRVNAGEAFMQGVILPYFLTEDDNATAIRDGGFGSTTPNQGIAAC